MSARILVVPGSNRAGSANRRLAAEAARRLALTDATVTLISLSDYPLPIFDADIETESGVPEGAVQLAQRIAAQDAMLIVTPEYNHSLAPLLKNTIDWVSRVRKLNGRPLSPFRKLIVGLAAASSGRYGGMRGLAALRPVLLALGAEVLTAQCTLANAASGFDEAGGIADEKVRQSLEALLDSLAEHARVLGRHL